MRRPLIKRVCLKSDVSSAWDFWAWGCSLWDEHPEPHVGIGMNPTEALKEWQDLKQRASAIQADALQAWSNTNHEQ